MTKFNLSLAVVVGVLAMSTTATAAPSCDTIWGNPATFEQNMAGIKKHLNIAPSATTVQRVDVGQLLVGYQKANCQARFERLPEGRQTPMGNVHHVLHASGKLPKGEWTPYMPVSLLEDLVRDGAKLGLPALSRVQVQTAQQAVQAVREAPTGENLATLGNELVKVKAELEESKAKDQETRKLLASVKATLAGLQTQDGLRKEQLAKLEQSFKEELQRLDALEQTVEEHGKLIAGNTGKINNLQLDVDLYKGAVEGLTGRMDTAETQIQETDALAATAAEQARVNSQRIDKQIDQAADRFEAVESEFATQSNLIAELQDGLNSSSVQLSSIKADASSRFEEQQKVNQTQANTNQELEGAISASNSKFAWTWGVGGFVVLVMVGGFGYLIWRQHKSRELSDVDDVAVSKADTALAEVKKVREEVAELGQRTDDLDQHVSPVEFRSELVKADQLQQREIGQSFVLQVTLNGGGGSRVVDLEVTRSAESQVTIKGIVPERGLESEVIFHSLNNVVRNINRAARQERIVGVPKLQEVS